jgi:molybdate/tungstate transport system permease protein
MAQKHNPISLATLLFSFLGGSVLLFVIAPLLGMALKTSFTDLHSAVIDNEVTSSIGLTLWASMAATLIIAIGAIPLSWLLARGKLPCPRLISAIVDLPIVIPHSAAGIALLGILSRNSLIGGAAESIGVPFVGGAAGIIAAMAFVSLPFLVNAARDGFAAVPEQLEKAALILGASPLRVFLTISLPLAWRSVLSGLILMWARGLSEFGAVVIIAYHPMVSPVLIFERFGAFGLNYARPVAVLFTAICLAVFVVLRLLSRRAEHATR